MHWQKTKTNRQKSDEKTTLSMLEACLRKEQASRWQQCSESSWLPTVREAVGKFSQSWGRTEASPAARWPCWHLFCSGTRRLGKGIGPCAGRLHKGGSVCSGFWRVCGIRTWKTIGENDWFSTFAQCVGMLCLISGGWLWAYREIKQRVSLPVVYFIKVHKYVFPGTSVLSNLKNRVERRTVLTMILLIEKKYQDTKWAKSPTEFTTI